MIKPNAYVSLLLTLLSGCTSLYKPPQSGPTATITFLKNETQNYTVVAYAEAATCTDRKLALANNETTKTINFTANKPLSLSFAADLGTKVEYQAVAFVGCVKTITFTPAVGGMYEAEFLIANGACTLKLRTAASNGHVATNYVSREWKRGFSESSSWCVAE